MVVTVRIIASALAALYVSGTLSVADAADSPDAAVPIGEAEDTSAGPADSLVGAEVRNRDDEHLGTLSEIVVAPETGQPAVAIVTRAGLLGIGEREVAVPWRLLEVIAGRDDVVVLDVSDEVLEAAPEPDADLLSIPEMFEEHRRVIEDYWAAQRQP